MRRQDETEHLVKIIEDAMLRAERLGLTLAVHILDIARLEVDQTEQHHIRIMPTGTPFGKLS
jgi:cell division protein FtsL